MKNRTDDIVAFFSDMFHLGKDYELPSNIVKVLNDLDRAERGELKSKLFNEGKRLGQGGDGLKAIRWLENSFSIIEKNSFRMHEVLFSPGQDIPENIAFHLSRAKKSIDLCVFTISDELLGKCLRAACSRGIKVRLITDGNKMRDTGSQVKDLARAGVQVKVDNSKYHMHNKFGLIDGKIAFTGSYNWTYTAKAYNQENLVITTNYTIVNAFIDEFDLLWEQMYTLKVKQRKDGRLSAQVNVNGTIVDPTVCEMSGDSRRQHHKADDDDDEVRPVLNPLTNTQDYKSRSQRKLELKQRRHQQESFDSNGENIRDRQERRS
ncbi:MAG: phospholipase D-like domain-containing protein [Bacteroidales bacterium]|nr:phospholipase D-like domain-containing protein [Bacteroidales bacterium]